MASLIVKQDLEDELQITLAASYTSTIITRICDYADDMLKLKTNRTTFTGSAANIAKYCEVCLAIDRLILSNRDLVKAAISSISENGGTVQFNNGKTLASYRAEAEQLIKDLKLPGTKDWSLTFADPDNEHTGNEGSLFY